ncbi:MAG: TIGR00266 family protein [Bifidobacteriaceae bacterium]|jgi:uncharacterized protein (TIGR00266 family)|nr:TIGR00266 family protein [Bifidobacteriaceae bacterium]
MRFHIESQLQFPLARALMSQGETVRVQRGAMIYRSAGVELSAHLNASGTGLGKFVKAVGRSMASGESAFITQATCQAASGEIAIAPTYPGTIAQLDVGADQYRLNDSAFLAMESSVDYTLERQSAGKALLGGQGGFFVMTTSGQGAMLVNAFGSISEIPLDNADGFVIDNRHVVAWDRNLDYKIQLESGFFGSIGTGEGVVNVFRGSGRVLVQSLNLESFAASLIPFIPTQR